VTNNKNNTTDNNDDDNNNNNNNDNNDNNNDNNNNDNNNNDNNNNDNNNNDNSNSDKDIKGAVEGEGDGDKWLGWVGLGWVGLGGGASDSRNAVEGYLAEAGDVGDGRALGQGAAAGYLAGLAAQGHTADALVLPQMTHQGGYVLEQLLVLDEQLVRPGLQRSGFEASASRYPTIASPLTPPISSSNFINF
jgi:hypothetical protein